MARITIIGGNRSNQTDCRMTRAAWNAATDGAAVPCGRAGSRPIAVADGRNVIVRLSAAANRVVVAGVVTDADTIARAAVHAAGPDGHGGNVGRVYDGDIIAVVSPDTARADWRRDHGMRRPAVGA
jgi:hypothetical protein